METIKACEEALRSFYLDVLANQLNTNINPLLTKIKKTSKFIEGGKKIVKSVPMGLNGGIGAGTEGGELPASFEQRYITFEAPLVNLYGTLEISDKAVRTSRSNSAFVNLLNTEMEALIAASKFNLGRMLYGNGNGLLAANATGTAGSYEITVPHVRNFMVGQVIDIMRNNTKDEACGARITKIDAANKKITVTKPVSSAMAATPSNIYLQGSKDKELIGLEAISDDASPFLYGQDKTTVLSLKSYTKTKEASETFDDIYIAKAIDEIGERSSAQVDFITCAFDVRRAYQKYLRSFARNADVMELEGGFKAISYNGIPIVADRFVADGTMYLINTQDYNLYQLCDWEWLAGDNGKILKQKEGYPQYTATLVKYAQLMNDRPNGQGKLEGLC